MPKRSCRLTPRAAKPLLPPIFHAYEARGQWHVVTHCLGTSTVPRCRSLRPLLPSPPSPLLRDSRASVRRMLRCLSKHANRPTIILPSVSPTRSGESSICRTSCMSGAARFNVHRVIAIMLVHSTIIRAGTPLLTCSRHRWVPQPTFAAMALRAAIAARKKAEAEAKKAATPPPIPATAPQPASASAAAPLTASAAAPVAGAFEVKKGFLAQSAGALYPEGSSEAAPGCWRGSASSARPVFRITTFEDKYEVVGAFAAAGDYLGKEDFEVTRSGLALEIRGNPQGDPQSLVAGLHEKVRACILRCSQPGRINCVTPQPRSR